MSHQPIIPLADRPSFGGFDANDSEQQTIWENPTQHQVVLELQVDYPKPGRPPRNWEEKTGKRRYVIGPGQTRALPSSLDKGIQFAQCHHEDCLQHPFECKSTEEGHEKTIVGGHGPQLLNRGTQAVPIRAGFYTLHESLDDTESRRKAAEAEEFNAWKRAKLASEQAEAARAVKLKAETEQLEAATRPNTKK